MSGEAGSVRRDIVALAAALLPGLIMLVARHRAHASVPSDGRGGFISDADVDTALTGLESLTESLDVEPSLPATAVDDLAGLFGLAELERLALVAAAAPDVDARFGVVYAYLNDDVHLGSLTTGVVLELAGTAVWDGEARARLFADGVLARSGLVELQADGAFLRRTLVVPDRVLRHLLGDDRVPDEIERSVAPLVPVDHAVVATMRALFAEQRWFLYVRSVTGDSAPSFAGRALHDSNVATMHVDLTRAPFDGRPDEFLRVAVREAALHYSALVIGPIDAIAVEHRAALDVTVRSPVPVVLYGRTSWDPAWTRVDPVLVEVPGLDRTQRLELWRQALGDAGIELDPAHAAATYHLAPADIIRGVEAAAVFASSRGQVVDEQAIAYGARSQNAIALERLARRITPRAGFDDLVVPDRTRRQLHELVAWVENRDRVIDELGMRGQGTKGRGVAGLFVGSSGTGKTLAAEVVAGELGLDLYVIDLSTVVSKYIGETEENLERVFREATGVNGILFFDEADALFGKRSEVSDSKDRYANMEVAYLLQRMEQFDGLSLLASNLRANLDEAFTRRLDFVVTFPDPPPAERERIWEVHLPALLPRADDVDLANLAARFSLSGGEIANAARAAAHGALREDGTVTMALLVNAVAREYTKIGRLLRPDDFGEWLADIDR